MNLSLTPNQQEKLKAICESEGMQVQNTSFTKAADGTFTLLHNQFDTGYSFNCTTGTFTHVENSSVQGDSNQ